MPEITLTMWAVRVKGTQCYLPRSQRRDERGGSHLDPIDFSLPPEERKVQDRYKRDMQIRAYATKVAAQNLLNSWLQGKYYGDEDGDIWTNPIPERNREDMEVVPLTIILPT